MFWPSPLPQFYAAHECGGRWEREAVVGDGERGPFPLQVDRPACAGLSPGHPVLQLALWLRACGRRLVRRCWLRPRGWDLS